MSTSTRTVATVSAVAATVLAASALALPQALAAPAPSARTIPAQGQRMVPVQGQRAVGPATGIRHSTSTNWAGYSATGSRFTSVSASWVQPAVTCTNSTTYSSFWIGIDGDGSQSVEQTGTEADCSGGSPIYSSWYEMYPAYPVNYADTVRPGDHFTSTVSTDGSGTFTLKLTDTTRGWTHTTSKRSTTAQLASAEVIAEAPSSSTSVLPLSNFGTASFTGATANGKDIGSFAPDQMNMAVGSTRKATTSSLSGGENFSVAWNHS